MTYEALKAEVTDLEARRGTLNKDERARLPWARKALEATPEHQEIERAHAREQARLMKELLEEAIYEGL